MKKIKSLLVLLAATFFLTFISSCDSEEGGSHDLVVRWNISGLKMCRTYLPAGQYAQEELAFTEVEINIYENESEEEVVQSPIIAPCGAGQQRITRLPRGSYFVTVDAFAEYDGEELAFFRGESDVSVPEEGNVVDIPLAVGNGSIEVIWQFTGGMICGLNDAGEVADIAVSLNGIEVEASCGDGRVVLEDIYPDNTYRITAVALDKNGDVLYDAIHEGNPFEVLPGQNYRAVVVFQ